MLRPDTDCRGQIVKKSGQYRAQINHAEMVKFFIFFWSKIHNLSKKFANNFVSDHSEVSVAMVRFLTTDREISASEVFTVVGTTYFD